MILTALVLIGFIIWGGMGCTPRQPISPDLAQAEISQAWQADQHLIWEVDWPAAPVGGPLTVETWRAGVRYRFEILESVGPDLIGQTLIFDGRRAWQYNRFDPQPPAAAAATGLAPVSDAFAIIDRLLATPAKMAVRQGDGSLRSGRAEKIGLTFENGDELTAWLDQETGLPVRILFLVGGEQATLEARYFEPLSDPPAGLFEPTVALDDAD